jgi:SAM-dependent methyltransferase
VFQEGGPTFGELARQALSSTRRGYDLLAPKFDLTPFRTPDWLLAAAAPHLGAPDSVSRALDLACGTGAALPLLVPLAREMVVGIDFSLGMLVEARRALRARSGEAVVVERARGSRPAVHLVEGDLRRLPLAGTFELAVVFGALGHVRPRDQPAFLAAVRDCLVPGGRLVFPGGALPPPWSPALWLAGGFDAAMWARNRLWRPAFVMYYLSWPRRRTRRRLAAAGFSVEERPLATPRSRARLVVATRRS